MHLRTRGLAKLALFAALAAALSLPTRASAQSQLDAAQARAFLGDWVLSMQTEMGPMSMTMSIKDQGGKVAASVGSQEMGGTIDVTDVSRDGESLLLKYNIDAQGMMVDVSMKLTPAGSDMETFISAAQGQFTATATATKAAS
jgi:hypothetical protein